MITKQVLRDAKALIQSPNQWTQTYGARNSNNQEVHCTDPEAVCFCAQGAIARIMGLDQWDQTCDPLKEQNLFFYEDLKLWDFNDHATHEEVLTMFDDLIDRAST